MTVREIFYRKWGVETILCVCTLTKDGTPAPKHVGFGTYRGLCFMMYAYFKVLLFVRVLKKLPYFEFFFNKSNRKTMLVLAVSPKPPPPQGNRLLKTALWNSRARC